MKKENESRECLICFNLISIAAALSFLMIFLMIKIRRCKKIIKSVSRKLVDNHNYLLRFEL